MSDTSTEEEAERVKPELDPLNIKAEEAEETTEMETQVIYILKYKIYNTISNIIQYIIIHSVCPMYMYRVSQAKFLLGYFTHS